jgi:ADP-ribosylglycohydrolase
LVTLAASQDAIFGGLYGLLIGDALGVPYEFRSPADLPPLEAIDLEPPAGFRRAHPAAPRAAWSDDGAHALCLLDSLLRSGRLDLDDLGHCLLGWWEKGTFAVERVVFDVGVQTAAALSAIRSGTPAPLAGPSEERHNGNGSLMRVLPLALWHTGSDNELIRDAALQSVVTHGHLRSRICCALYALWARGTLARVDDAWRFATLAVREYGADDKAWSQELDVHIRPEAPARGNGTGYVVDCLHSARFALEEASFERVLQRAVSLGHDTDTTAAVAGGIAGLRHGYAGIPERWRSALAGQALVEPLAGRLLSSLRR